MRLTNKTKLGLSMAVMLANDNYQHDSRPNAISVTGMLKSTRQIILSQRAKKAQLEADVLSFAAASFGNAVHDAVEKAWTGGRHVNAMRKLGIPESQIARVVVNYGYKQAADGNWERDHSVTEPLPPDAIPVYLEIRTEREFMGFIITGKFDFVGDGELEDHKTTGVYTYIKNATEKFREQGSIYKWLNPDKITSDRLLINYTFTDFSNLRRMIEKDKGYPDAKMMSVPMTMMTAAETEKFIEGKVRELKAFWDKPESAIPLCTQEELWQADTVYKYYKNPLKKKKSTKNCSTFAEAQKYMVKDLNVGEIDVVKGKAKFCEYCSGLTVCAQAKSMIAEGVLEITK